MDKQNTAKLQLITSMIIFGTIGIFVRYIPMSSSVIAMTRGIIGSVVILIVMALQKNKLSKEAIKKNGAWLLISGAFIGINWILLFESYRFTTVATATLCYYMAPIFVMIASPFILKEHLPWKKAICVVIALIGMVFVSGIVNIGFNISELKGVFLGLGAAAFYASVILLNKKIHDISAYDKTVVQLLAATVVIIPYVLLTENITQIQISTLTVIMLLVVGVIHTGFAYTMYFGSMKDLKAQTVALFGYIDPVVAIILSAVILHEAMDALTILGAVLVLGSTVASDFMDNRG